MKSPVATLVRAAAARMRTAGPLQWSVWAATVAAGLVGLWWGYGFGDRLAGPLVGVVVAINLAAICSMVADALLERVVRPRR